MTSNIDQNFIITIGRQFGSGGREIGQLVAEKLGIAYYDHELLVEAAKSTGMRSEIFEDNDERYPKFFANLLAFSNYGSSFLMGNSPISDSNIYHEQCEVILSIAKQKSCVILGRTADYILRNEPNAISIFIHSSMEQRIARIMKRENCKTPEEAKTLAEKKNKIRAEYYNFYTDKVWGDAQSYDLSIDSSKLSVEETANLIVAYAKSRLSSK